MEGYEIDFVHVPGTARPMSFRKDTTDFETLKYVFLKMEYRLPALAFKPQWIIDAGANVGYSSVFFADTYPGTCILAIEPDAANFEMLQINTAGYGQIEHLHSGLWNKNGYLIVKDVGLGEWGMMVEEVEELGKDAFKSITMPSLLENYKIETIDILKLNIEGAEKELFADGYEEWLPKVKIIIIELHDRMKPGCSQSFFNAVKEYNFLSFKRGANFILYQKGCFA